MRSLLLIAAAAWASPAFALDLCQPPAIAPSTTVVIQVSGANPGESVTLARSSAPGSTCVPALGGACLQLANPVVVGTRNADAQGVATFTLALPSTLPVGARVGMQAAVRRGAGGVASVLSDAFFTRTVAVAQGQDCGTGNVCANADGDGDLIHDVCDVCPNGSDTSDGDLDGVPDGCDVCPGGDDALDGDMDMVPDACDVCPFGDDAADADMDMVPDACDVCDGGDDNADADMDMVPDACDVCPGGDDFADADMDMAPDACDVCPGGDDRVDTDMDGVPDDCETPDNGLRAWWSFEGGSGMDSSGRGNDVTAFNNVTFSAGVSGTAMRLRGLGWADVAPSADFDLQGGFTFTAWIRPDNLTNFRGIVARARRTGAVQDWGFYTRGDELCTIVNYPNPASQLFTTTANLTQSQWVHVASAWDPTTGQVHFYKNGAWVQSVAFAGPLASNNTPVVLGTDGGSADDFIGFIDEVTVWARPLDAAEIADLATL